MPFRFTQAGVLCVKQEYEINGQSVERFIHKAGICIIWMKYEHANWFVKHGFGFKVYSRCNSLV